MFESPLFHFLPLSPWCMSNCACVFQNDLLLLLASDTIAPTHLDRISLELNIRMCFIQVFSLDRHDAFGSLYNPSRSRFRGADLERMAEQVMGFPKYFELKWRIFFFFFGGKYSNFVSKKVLCWRTNFSALNCAMYFTLLYKIDSF